MGEKGEQAENGNDVELNLLRSVCHPLRKRMDREEEHSQANHAQQHEPSRNMQEHVSLARRRNKERQVTGGYRVGRHCHGRGPLSVPWQQQIDWLTSIRLIQIDISILPAAAQN